MNKFLSVALLLLVGCGEKVIDTSSDANMKASIAEIKKSLPEDKKEVFDKALTSVIFSESFGGGDLDSIKFKLEGKTADQVIKDYTEAQEKAKQMKAEREIQAENQRKALEEAELKRLKDKQDERNNEIKDAKTKFLKLVNDREKSITMKREYIEKFEGLQSEAESKMKSEKNPSERIKLATNISQIKEEISSLKIKIANNLSEFKLQDIQICQKYPELKEFIESRRIKE